MNPQKITEWLFSGDFMKGVFGAGVSGTVMLYSAIQMVDHKINIEKIQTESRFAQLESKINSDINAIYRYVDSEKELNKVQFKYIAENLSDIKKALEKNK